jgi:uncharacterized protein YfkK (UPF0435 family)
MGKKLTLEKAKQEFINRGYTPLFNEYNNTNEKLLARNNEGYKIIVSLSKLKGDRTPQPFSDLNPYTIENIKLWLKLNNLQYELISNTYINSTDKIILNCPIHGEFKVSWNKLQNGTRCKMCSMKSKIEKTSFSIEKIKEKLKYINPSIEILSKEYINAKTKLKCRCLIDNNIWYSNWSSLSQGKGCPLCGGSKKLTLEYVKERFKSLYPNIEIVSTKYIGNKSNLKCRCLICGYKWESNWSHLKNCKGCPECSENRRDYTIEDIKEKLKIINPFIKILSDEYINKDSKLLLQCSKDGNKWSATWGSLSHNQGCPKCAIESLKKSKIGENNPSWKGGISTLSLHLRQFISQWKKDSLIKYDYKCDITGVDKNLIIHHLYGFNQILQETMNTLQLPIYEEINQYTDKELKSIEKKCLELHYKYGLGICLCKEEHKIFHTLYGYGNNTKEQYEEFKQNKVKELNKVI